MIPAFASLILLVASTGDAVATADGVEITRAELRERADELRGRGMPSSPEDALDSVVLDVLLAGEARRTGLAESPAVRARVEREKRRAAAAAMLAKEVGGYTPSDDELRELFHATADSVRLKTLVFPSEDAARVNLALAQRSGNFDDAARSAVPGIPGAENSAPRIRGQLSPALAELAFKLPVGSFGGPVELSAGWGIVKVIDRTVGDDATFAAQRESITRFARKQRADATRQHLKQQLRRGARVTIDDAFLESLGKRPDVSAAELDHVVATVGGERIAYREIDASVRGLSGSSGHLAGPAVRKQILVSEIEDRLLETAAAERGFVAAPEVVARVPRIERRALATAFVEKVGASVPAPTEKEIRKFYEANVAGSGQPLESVRAGISAHLLQSRRDDALLAKGRELRKRAAVSVDREALRSTFAS